MFEVLQEVCTSSPSLATRMLVSLLKILEGLDPETLRNEDTALLDDLSRLFAHLTETASDEAVSALVSQVAHASASCTRARGGARTTTGQGRKPSGSDQLKSQKEKEKEEKEKVEREQMTTKKKGKT